MVSADKLPSRDAISVALREGNGKRRELLVNSLQAKHVPSSPKSSLGMMAALASLVAEKNIGKPLVIGFAETAPAIGAMLASCLGPDCFYIHTTREAALPNEPVIEFLEEHSHAVNQSIHKTLLVDQLRYADSVIFVDDEITTGKTLLNAIDAIDGAEHALRGKTILAASIVNRVGGESKLRGLRTRPGFISLFSDEGWSMSLTNPMQSPAECCKEMGVEPMTIVAGDSVKPGNPRKGVRVGDYRNDCNKLGNWISTELGDSLEGSKTVTVVGTEECMFPAIACGKAISELFPETIVKCHATTRSPISISNDDSYPIKNGCMLRSVYDCDRRTFIYNLASYDLVIVVTDAPLTTARNGLKDLAGAFAAFGTKHIVAVVI